MLVEPMHLAVTAHLNRHPRLGEFPNLLGHGDGIDVIGEVLGRAPEGDQVVLGKEIEELGVFPETFLLVKSRFALGTIIRHDQGRGVARGGRGPEPADVVVERR